MLDADTAKALIKPRMPVLCSQHDYVAIVDHVDTDAIDVTVNGEHHAIPLEWVASVDDKVHLDRPGDAIVQAWS
jgi:hypothetical protein